MPHQMIEEDRTAISRSGRVAQGGSDGRLATKARHFRPYVYLLTFIAPSVLLTILGVFIAPSQWLSNRIQDPFLDDVGYGATLHNVNCELVIYGDSSAEVGLDAVALQQRTGMSTCNLAEPASMTVLNGTTILDRYLAQNSPPRVLVFFFAPEHLNPHPPNTSVGAFEAITYRMNQPDKLAYMASMWREPLLLFTWASFADERAARIIAAQMLTVLHVRPRVSGYDRHSRLERQGSLTLPGFVTGDCQTMPEPQQPDASWINSLRKKYQSRDTLVLVDAMAIPDCDPGLEWDQSHLRDIVDNGVTTLPISVFFPFTRHVNAEGSTELTDRLAAQILASRDRVMEPQASKVSHAMRHD